MINTNYQISDSLLRTPLDRLATGKKINNAADNAGGLAMATQMLAELGGTNQAGNNVQQGLDMLRTAEGGMSNVSDSLGRMRELAAQASNGTLSNEDRTALNSEFQALRDQIGSVSQTTEYNGNALLKGGSDVSIQAGPNSGDQVKVGTGNVTPKNLAVAGLNISTQDGAQAALSAMDKAIGKVSNQRADVGATENKLEATANNLSVSSTNISSSVSGIMDTDYGEESSKLATNNVLQQANIYTQSVMNKEKGAILSLLA